MPIAPKGSATCITLNAGKSTSTNALVHRTKNSLKAEAGKGNHSKGKEVDWVDRVDKLDIYFQRDCADESGCVVTEIIHVAPVEYLIK